MSTWELLTRLLMAAGAGMALGLERQRGGHAAGARTHLLVAVGACMFTLAGAYGFGDADRSTVSDPARIAAQVASGIGFLGAGTILRDGRSTRGLTTAATLWISGAVGVGMGSGLFVTTAAAVAIIIVALVVLAAINNWRDRGSTQTAEISLTYRGTEAAHHLWSALRRCGGQVQRIQEARNPEDGTCTLVVVLDDLPELARFHEVIESVKDCANVQTLDILRP